MMTEHALLITALLDAQWPGFPALAGSTFGDCYGGGFNAGGAVGNANPVGHR